ncbi:CAP domain-containing protein [Streptomyces sp. PKU-EA00015]|uniref:CAP domain-containing protein n=1 Tax=Streptomyces sp. PKU-EA00015 TaxID=2748326 RepID=UPI00210D2307|nr:CAP domain-containing protein [Streptomyces sp. PKU-EA00015]
MHHEDSALPAGDEDRPRGPAAVRTTATAAVALAVAVSGLLGGRAVAQESLPASGGAPLGAAAHSDDAPGKATEHARRIVSLVNVHRRRAGCAPLRIDDRLQAAAQAHADDMAARGYYAHESPEGRDGGDRLKVRGYAWSRWAENIHRGPAGPAATVAGWMGSAVHRENVMDCRLEYTGVGISLKGNGPWWVQEFATRD